MRVVKNAAEPVERRRQEGEGLLQADLIAFQGAAGGVLQPGHLEDRIRRVAVGQQRVGKAGGAVGEAERGGLDVGSQILVEGARRQDGPGRGIPFDVQIQGVGADRIEVRIADGQGFSGIVDRAAGGEERQLGARHHLGGAQAHQPVLARLQRQSEGREDVVIGARHAHEGGRDIAARGRLGPGIADAHVAAQAHVHDLGVEIQLQIGAGVALGHIAVGGAHIVGADPEVAVGIDAVAIEVEQAGRLAHVRRQPGAGGGRRQVEVAPEIRGQPGDAGQADARRQGHGAVGDAADGEPPAFAGGEVIGLGHHSGFQLEGFVEGEFAVQPAAADDVCGLVGPHPQDRGLALGAGGAEGPGGGVGHVDAVDELRPVLVPGVVVGIGGCVVSFEGEGGLDGIVLDRAGIAIGGLQLQAVAEFAFDVERDLLELAGQLVVPALRADIDVVHRRGDQLVAAVYHWVAHIDHIDALARPGEVGLQIVFVTPAAEVGIEAA